MIIRKAEEKDIPRILELLKQVLQIHADIVVDECSGKIGRSYRKPY